MKRVGDLEAGPQSSFGRLIPGSLDGAPGDTILQEAATLRGDSGPSG